jgi:chitin disaccharide deacetylase
MTDRLLIINADDLGYDPEITRGILECMRDGIVSSATLMVNTPFSEEAANQARDLAVGLHLNLARGRPVSNRFPESLLADGALAEELAARLTPEVVADEALAQLERLEALLGKSATHIDVHRHLHRLENVRRGVCSVANACALPLRSIDAPMRSELLAQGVKTADHFLGDAAAEPYWTLSRLEAAFDQVTSGVTELMCHPGYAPSAVRSGYGKQREVELRTFRNPLARRQLEQRSIVLTDFRVLRGGRIARGTPS